MSIAGLLHNLVLEELIVLLEIAATASHVDLLDVPLVFVCVSLDDVPVVVMDGVFSLVPPLNVANIPTKQKC